MLHIPPILLLLFHRIDIFLVMNILLTPFLLILL